MSNDKNAKTIEELKAEVDRRSHPAAKVFPLLIDTDANAWDQFCADVDTNGLRSPILIDRPKADTGWLILDGRNRYLACMLRSIEPEFEVVDVRDRAAVELVISANLRRRHDDVSVRAAQLAKLLEMLKVENFPTPSFSVAAAAAGMSDRTLRDAGRLRKTDPELADQVAEGNISGHAARHIADLPPGEERDELKRKVAAAGSKMRAKRIVGETRGRSSRRGT
jgi:ParB-like chromosome segregation protein Spo0J